MTHQPDVDNSEIGRRAPRAVVGLGASAGGITALREFFAIVPSETGIAWVVILHLSPEHDSKLAEILQTTADIPVTQVREAVVVEPDHVYVVPPNKSLSIVDDKLTVSEVTRPEQRRAPVDVFFRALADAHGSRSICVVLSGTGPNGSAGLKRIKEYGGLAIAQDPADAEYPDMPRNSIATGLVDFVLPVAQIPPRIIDYVDGLRRSDVIEASESDDSNALREIMTTLRVRTGHEFSNYKSATLRRRIQRRIHLRGVVDINEYARLIRQNPDESVALMKELLISVTNFFRDPQAWAVLEERILPQLFLTKTMHDQIRVWVAGCATGEEAYSLAMMLAEYQATSLEQPSIQVFGTDLDEHAIAIAREGVYTDAEVADVSDERLQRFFHKQGGGYRVRRDLRETLLFAHHNLIKDPPFSHLDLISCRNLLIYLNRSVQERVIETFHFALRPGGYLFLGSSESPDGANDFFRRVDGAAHLYESRGVASRLVRPLVGEGPLVLPQLPVRAPEPRTGERISPADLHQRLLEEYAPPSLVVTEEYNVVHMSAQVGRYLQVSGGEPSRDLIRMAHPDLRGDLRTAINQAARDRTRVDVPNVIVAFDEGPRAVEIVVRPVLRETDPVRGYFVVMFQDGSVAPPPEPSATLGGPREPVSLQLEEELQRVKGQLRVTVEQYETQAEEAKASNEELQAMNEELRSAAEELETSKEELQSVNEELTTVNQELKIKIEELRLTNNDFQNFINSTDIGTIFLDRSLRVKLFTPRAQDIFNLMDADVGRPLSDITHRLKDERIHSDVRNVLESLQSVEREMETDDRRSYLMRMLPYRTLEDRIEGVVVTFQDTTSRRKAEQAMREWQERLRVIIDSADYAIFTFDGDGLIDTWNAGAERLFGYRADEILGSQVETLFTPEDRAAGIPEREIEVARRQGRANDERYHLRKDGTRFYVSGVTTRIGDGSTGFAKIARDLTDMRQASDALKTAHQEVEHRVLQRTAELEMQKAMVSDLLGRVVSAQEDERARIARDLHDSVGQQLTALRLALERHEERCGVKGNDGALDDAVSLTQMISRDIEFLAWELRPTALDDLGLEKALPRFLEAWSSHVGVVAEFRMNAAEGGYLSRELQVAFYRIVQEALNNVAKHAHATRVDVLLSTANGQVVLVIEDDGVGFELTDPSISSRGIGLASMRERAGLAGATLDVESTIGRGTAVYIKAAPTEGAPERNGA